LKPSRDRWNQFWRSTAASAVDLDSDLPRLVRWIKASDEYDRAAKVVKASRLVRGSMGQPVLNPLINYLANLEAMITRTEREFGMTPAARRRMDLNKAPSDDEIERFFAELGAS